jgi:hypothetical protein
MKFQDRNEVMSLIRSLLVKTRLVSFCYTGIFTLQFEEEGCIENTTRLEVLTNVYKYLNDFSEDEIQQYLESCNLLREIISHTVKEVTLLPNNCLLFKFDNIEVLVNSLHLQQFAFMDISWTIKAKRNNEIIELICDGDSDIFGGVAPFGNVIN